VTAAPKLKPCVGVCGRVLALSEFRRDPSHHDGHADYCRDCAPIRHLIAMRLDDAEELSPQELTPAMTFEEIGEELGLTRQRVQQIEATALRKLRNNAFAMAAIRRLLEA